MSWINDSVNKGLNYDDEEDYKRYKTYLYFSFPNCYEIIK